MVKGVTRQVILVKSPDPRLFEQAIFIVKEEALNRRGVSQEQVIQQAQAAANDYLKRSRAWSDREHGLTGWLWAVLGAASASLVWLLGFVVIIL